MTATAAKPVREFPLEQVAATQGEGFELQVKGLRGGHSGVDIHRGRGNANKLLARLLRRLSKQFGGRVASFSGGTARNAIPRSAGAVIALPASHKSCPLGYRP